MLSPQPTTLDDLVEKAQKFDQNWQIFGRPSGTPSRGQGSSKGNWYGNLRIQEIKEAEIEIAATQLCCRTSKKQGKLTLQER